MSDFRAFCLANNSAQQILPDRAPWLNTAPVPKFGTKDKYRAWCADTNTQHLFFSLVEAEISSLRVGSGNKPFRVHGLVADYDCPGLTDAEVAKGLARLHPQFPPFAWNRTFSGGVRAIWRFERPVFYYSQEVFEKLYARVIKETKAKSAFAGLDEHVTNASLHYCAGAGWTVNESAFIRGTLLDLWIFDACKTEKLSSGIEIPLDVVAAEVQAKFPGRWEGAFEEGSRGVRFWDPTGDAKSALIRKTGVVCFTGLEPFKSWRDIFGPEFVSKYLEDRRGKAIAEMYSDGDTYYRKLSTGAWDDMGTDTAKRHLKVTYGLLDRVSEKGDPASEIDMVLNHLESKKRVEGLLPFPLIPKDVVEWNGVTYLNRSTARLLQPHPEKQEWGINFQWLAGYLSTLFLDEQNLLAFLSWLHVWIKSAHAGSPCRGQALFIVGPPGTGKSLLSRQVLARIFGGYADARAHLVDGGMFNSELFEKALWVIDDSTVLADRKAHSRYSSLVKASAANDSFPYAKKYGYQGAVPFSGRLVVTMNDDPVSIGILPDTDQSLLDKAYMLRTDAIEADVAQTEAERYAIIDRELPAFVRWVLDFEMPDWIQRDPRFGIKAWHDREVLAEAKSVSYSSAILDSVDLWRIWHGDSKTPRPKLWRGSSSELLNAMYEQDSPAKKASFSLTSVQLGRQIHVAVAGGCDWIKTKRESGSGKRIIEIEIPPAKKST